MNCKCALLQTFFLLFHGFKFAASALCTETKIKYIQPVIKISSSIIEACRICILFRWSVTVSIIAAHHHRWSRCAEYTAVLWNVYRPVRSTHHVNGSHKRSSCCCTICIYTRHSRVLEGVTPSATILKSVHSNMVGVDSLAQRAFAARFCTHCVFSFASV